MAESNITTSNQSGTDLVEELAKALRTIERLRRSESKRKRDKQVFAEITHALKERVKELNCLYSISDIVEKSGLDLDMVLKRVIEIIPVAWQYPEITCCRINIEGKVVQNPDFMETPWRQAQDIIVNGKPIGVIEVFYRQEKPVKDEGPFLAEERSLINAIAERMAKLVERNIAEKALHESELKNIALLNAIPDLMFQVEGNGRLIGFHKGAFTKLNELGSRLIGKDIYYLADHENMLPRRLVDQAMTYVKRALETGNPQIFEQHASLDGKGRDYEVRMVVCGSNEVLGIVRDMTRRKQLEREILEISNREQRRIGQDLHDSLCQHLAGIAFMGKVMEKKAASNQQIETEDVAEIVDLIDQAITLTKGYARGLNPVEFQAGGLMYALGKLAESMKKLFGVSCTCKSTIPINIKDNEMAANLYRIVQEAINNAIKHGKADKIQIIFERKGGTCMLSVIDNGIGIGRSKSYGKGMGLNIMRYRASMFGASLDIKNCDNGGAAIVCTFPLSEGL